MTNQKGEKNLDQVRELIFGEQMRKNENKFTLMEERLDDIKKDISKAEHEANQRFKQVEKEAQKLHNKLESHIEKVKKELSDSIDSTRSQILKKIDQLIQEKSDRMELGNMMIEMGMRIKGEDLMETLKERAEADKNE
jgi:DNA anti-recombination protein RmuC